MAVSEHFDEVLTVRLGAAELRQLRTLARREKRTVSNMVRALITRAYAAPPPSHPSRVRR